MAQRAAGLTMMQQGKPTQPSSLCSPQSAACRGFLAEV